MTGRGRGRPPSRSAPEPAAGPSRRSTRHQQQNQNAAQPDEAQQQLDTEQQQQLQGRQEQTHGPAPQVEAPMAVPEYHGNIDPAITGPQDTNMPPPPLPSARGHNSPQFPRRYAPRDGTPASSVREIITSSQAEPESTASQGVMQNHRLGTPARALSVLSSAAGDTPGRRAARAKLMSHMLMPLFNAADELVAHLNNGQLDLEIWEGMRIGLKKVFDAYRAHYVAADSDPVVDPAFVIGTMGIPRASPLWYKAFKIVSATNLATLFNDITPVNQEGLLPLLEVLDAAFHDCYVGEVPESYGLALEEQVVEQVLTIRTQLAIFRLQRLQADGHMSFHPREEVAKIWCDGDPLAAVEAVRGNNREALQLRPITPADSELAPVASDHAGKRFFAICSMLPDQVVEGYGLDLKEVQEEFPVDQFMESLRNFAKDCFGRTTRSVHAERDQGVTSGASDASRADSQIRSQLETEAMAHAMDRAESAASSVGYDVDALRMMKQLEQQVPSAYRDPGQYGPARIPYPPEFVSGLGFGDAMQQGGFSSSGSLYAESAAQVSARKRGAQDDPTATGDGAAAATAPPAKKPRARRKKNTVPEAAMGSPAAAAPSSVTALVAASQYPPLPGTQDEPDFEALSARTRELSAASRKAKEPQVRSPWVQKDIRLLVKAVNTYQCKWSTIEKEIKAGTIPFERPRDQQALRDKARLLKQDLLKADAVLPRGFDLVVLGKKEREAVKALGKNPDRKEADVDENGRPIDTEFDAEAAAAPAPNPAPLPPAEEQQEEQPQPQQELQPAAPEEVAA